MFRVRIGILETNSAVMQLTAILISSFFTVIDLVLLDCFTVGNIPYDATEEQLIDICKEVGPVVSFRYDFN